MYLRLAERQVALAERLERLEDQAGEHADLQARADTEVRAAAPKAREGSPPRYKSRKRRAGTPSSPDASPRGFDC